MYKRKKETKRKQAASKRRRKVVDKTVITHQDKSLPESSTYTDLVAFEAKLDSLTTRKRYDIQEALKMPVRTKKTMRIFVSNTHADQQAADPEAASWTLKVEGRILDDTSTNFNRKRFTTFFGRVYIEFDIAKYSKPDRIVEWHSDVVPLDADGFEVTRKGTQSVVATVLLWPKHDPPRYKLAPNLAALLQLHTASRPTILTALWQYIKKHKLQVPTEREFIKCDSALSKIFEKERVRFSELPELLASVILPAEPIRILYEINVDPLRPNKPAIYDVEIELGTPTPAQLTYALTVNVQRDIYSQEEQIGELISEIKKRKRKRDFMLSFAEDPDQFLATWIASQTQEAQAKGGLQEEPYRSTAQFQLPWAQEAAARYFSAKANELRISSQTRHAELTKYT